MDEHPELLLLVPKRWRANPVVIAALTGVCLILAGCRSNAARAEPSRIAPVFVHGEGRGSYGCRVINPPVFLSEAEARQVILEEGKKAGVVFKTDSAKLNGVKRPLTDRNGDDYAGRRRPATRYQRLDLDGTDRKKKISFEYVSLEDFQMWENPKAQRTSAGYYDIRRAAAILRDGLRRARPEGSYAVFYDPLAKLGKVHYGKGKDFNTSWKARDAEARKIAREEVRKQVRDFIKWLKAQGVV